MGKSLDAIANEMFPRPKLTVLVCNRNCAALLPRALDSALGQEVAAHDFEVVVVDDGSCDESREVLRSYQSRATVVFQEPRGLPDACNVGIATARGELLVRLDADDELLPGALQELIAALDADPDAVMAIGNRIDVQQGRESERPVSPGQLFDVIAPGMAFRTELLREIGGYRRFYWEEYDLDLRLLGLGGIVHVDRPLYRYHRRADSMTADDGARIAGWKQLLDEWGVDALRRLGHSDELESVAAVADGRGGGPGPVVHRRRIVRLGDRHVRKLFEGRRVCVVGCARSLLDLRQGPNIDRYDVVVRLNDFVVDDQLAAAVGRRADVVVLNNHVSRFGSRLAVADLLSAHDYPVLLSASAGWILARRLRSFPHTRDVRVGQLPRCETSGRGDARAVPSTGTLTVAALLQQTELAELYATGFDFYTGRASYYYSDARVVDTRHDMPAEMAYWRSHLQVDSRLSMDAMLQRLLADPPGGVVPAGGFADPRLAGGEQGARLLDLRSFESRRLEVKCGNATWLVALAGGHPRLHVDLEAVAPLVLVALPRQASYTIGVARPATRIEDTSGEDPLRTGHCEYRSAADGGPAFELRVTGSAEVVRLVRW